MEFGRNLIKLRKNRIVLIALFSFILLQGCMSLRYRCGADFPIDPGPYPGLRITGRIVEQSFQDAETFGMVYGMWFYWVPDIPISFCFDTLCLPYDIAHLSEDSSQNANEDVDASQ